MREVLDFFRSRFGEGLLFEINYVPLAMNCPQVVYENRTVELLAFPLNHRVDTYGFMIREKVPPLNVRKDAVAMYGLSIAEIGALKRGEDVIRMTDGRCQVISNADAAYRPYVPRSYAYCSDTAPFTELAEWVKGVSLLYHETTFPASMEDMAARTFHSTTLQAAQTARDAGVGKLIVGHYSSRFHSPDFYLDEIRTVFPEAQMAHDMDVFEIPLVKKG